jgi:murein DD-endopeptidase MepM/ murein hydrolase activator NlpD
MLQMAAASRAGWMGGVLLFVCLTGCTTLRRSVPSPVTPAEPAVEPAGPEIPPPAVPATPEPRIHVVERGETLTAIARRYGTTVPALVEANRLADPDRLEVGQRLTFPGDPAPVPGPAAVQVSGMAWPVDGGHVLSPFGAPRSGRAHTGVDIGGKAGQAILAAEDGVVVFTGTLRGYGNTVVLDHGEGLRSLYAHNREATVAEGASVRRGDTIALLGRSGNATTDHCHFEVRQGEVPLDPLPLLSQAEKVTAGARP